MRRGASLWPGMGPPGAAFRYGYLSADRWRRHPSIGLGPECWRPTSRTHAGCPKFLPISDRTSKATRTGSASAVDKPRWDGFLIVDWTKKNGWQARVLA